LITRIGYTQHRNSTFGAVSSVCMFISYRCLCIYMFRLTRPSWG
jgi:hypothetical protein